MVARYLVTTALETTWPAENEPVLFLGEWCCLYDRKSVWESRDAVVVPYHWDDRQKLHQDYLYLRSVYENLLNELAAQLNELHHVNYSVRYWRILVGPWLGYFIQMLFDRWTMLRHAFSEYDISGVRVLHHREEDLLPNDLESFIPLFINDPWNELIYGQILDWMGIPVEKVNISHDPLPISSDPVNLRLRLKRRLIQASRSIFGLFCQENEHFLIASYLGVTQDILLQAKLGQIPKLWRLVDPPVCAFDPTLRQWKMEAESGEDDFITLARALIPTHIPKLYVEGYLKLAHLTESLPWPKRPKTIFTSNSYSSDDVFKAWAAHKVESGVPLIIGQHGGNYGMGLWSFTEDHQTTIADRFVSWGWVDEPQSKITPVGNLKGFDKSKHIYPNPTGVALLVGMALPRQSYHMWSSPVGAGQWLQYLDEQCRFAQALPAKLREQLLVRLYSQDNRLSQKQRWQERIPEIHIDEGIQPMSDLLKKTRIYISTYNATTYLESLSLNFPTIIFWNPKHWELRPSAHPYFEQLKSVGIFHETPESAAKQMTAVWDDVSSWWHSPSVQSVRRAFCEQYAHIPDAPLDSLGKIFCSVANGIVRA